MRHHEDRLVRPALFPKPPYSRRQLRRALRLRTNLGSFFLSDSADRYWRVHVRVSKRRGRYMKLEHQGTPGVLRVDDFRATADDHVTSRYRAPYQHITPIEWERFAALANRFDGRCADEQDPELTCARSTLDRIVAEHARQLR